MREKHVLGHTCHGLDNESGQKDTEASILNVVADLFIKYKLQSKRAYSKKVISVVNT